MRPLLSVLLLSSITNLHAARYHVNGAATGSGTGLSWTDAFTNLQDALSVVIPGDEIWVAAGHYRPTTGTSRTISFNLRNGVNLYGGFAGTESSVEERDIAGNPTVLNGDIGEPGTPGDNAHRVVTANNINTHIVLDGFRIMNGYSASGSGYNGGGLNIQNIQNGSLMVRNCTIVNNYSGTYGGGIYLAAANLTIENCDLLSNSAGTGGDGGAIYNGNNNGGYSNLVIRDSRFKNNTGRRGACLHGGLDFNSLLIERCRFTANTAKLSIIEIDGFNNATISDSYLIGNAVDDSGANILRIQTSASDEVLFMTNCTFVQNFNLYANPGSPAIRVYGTHHRIENSIIHGNTSHNGSQVSSGMNIFHSIVQGGHANGTAIVDADPVFNAPSPSTNASFDATLFDYTLAAGSPAINTGSNDLVPATSLVDLAGAPRIQGGTVDMGCYESDLSTTIATAAPANARWYHDPTSGLIHLTTGLHGAEHRLFIHDMHGRLVTAARITSDVFPVALPSGAYIATSAAFGRLKLVVR